MGGCGGLYSGNYFIPRACSEGVLENLDDTMLDNFFVIAIQVFQFVLV